MAQTIKLKRGTTTPTTSNIIDGEVAIDTAAQKLYVNDGGTVKEVSPVSVAFDDLTGKDSGTGTYATTGQIIAGKGNGGVSLTHNDGYGNANVCFNHRSGTPEQNGNSGRIVVNTDAVGNANFKFEVQSNVTGGVAVDPALAMEVRQTELQIPGNLVHAGDLDTYLRFTLDRIRLYAGGTVKIDTNNTYLTYSNVPASATATGTAGDIAYDANYIYICTATNTWKRAALSTW